MQLPMQEFFIKDLATDPVAGLESGEVFIGENGFTFQASDATECTVLCRKTGEAQITKITFGAIAASPCDDCDYCVGFKISYQRSSNFDVETYLDTPKEVVYRYPFDETTAASVTPADIATHAAAFLNTGDTRRGPSLFRAAVDPLDADSIYITNALGDYTPFTVYEAEDCGVITIAETSANDAGALTPEEVGRRYALGLGFIPGQDLENRVGHDSYPLFCKNPCLIILTKCTTECQPAGGPNQNRVHLGGVLEPVTIGLWVDQDHADYATWLAALDTLLDPLDCTDVTPAAIGGPDWDTLITP